MATTIRMRRVYLPVPVSGVEPPVLVVVAGCAVQSRPSAAPGFTELTSMDDPPRARRALVVVAASIVGVPRDPRKKLVDLSDVSLD